MSHIIDRRPNSKNKNLPNVIRFRERHKKVIQEAVKKIASQRNIADTKGNIEIGINSTSEPRFRKSRVGNFDHVGPGNESYQQGETIEKQSPSGGRGRNGARGGEGEDDFTFLLSEKEYLDILFADLELPDLVKKTLLGSNVESFQRAGYTTTGSPANFSILKTMSRAMARRISLHRPSIKTLEALEEEIFQTEDVQMRGILEDKLVLLQKRKNAIPHIDNIDVRYRNTIKVLKPKSKAVMFCLMDVSASMGEREKDLAKRFFLLLNVFLKQKYDQVDIRFIRHTHEAKLVEEEEFFYGRETGGTVVSSSLELTDEIIDKEYNSEWNVYVANASDGDNTEEGDELLEVTRKLIPRLQYFAYLETRENGGGFMGMGGGMTTLWRQYEGFNSSSVDFKIAMKKAFSPADIYPVFVELFSKNRA